MLVEILRKRITVRMTTHDVRQQSETIVAVTHTLTRTTRKTSLIVKTLCDKADSLICKILAVNQLLLKRILDSHRLSRLVHNDTRKREISTTVTHQMPQLYRLILILVCELRNVLGHRIIHRENSIHLHLHDRQRRERLRHRCHTKDRITVDRELVLLIAVTKILLILDLSLCIHNADCNTTRTAILHHLSDKRL